MNIKVKIKNVYGNELIYPICDQAKMFANIARQATITRQALHYIKALGYTIEVVAETL